ncbi:MAG: hypothetical protein E7562_03430 [Ruminococcaceae bacterium]|nr:hypothetical protein [Oscillospiraceae bacterium]
MESSVFLARVYDTANACERTSTPRFLGFLTPDEAAAADKSLKTFGIKYRFFGGYDSAERTMLSCLPDWCDEVDYPITSITFLYRACDKLTHRDFLGALMGLGLTRESVGDILVENGRTVVFVKSDISNFVVTQVSKVGSCGVTVKVGFELPLPTAGTLMPFSDTVSSPRLDSVVASLCSCSRNTACELISDGKVSVNSLMMEKNTRTVIAGDRITVRGKGKFIIDSVNDLSKKGRVILKYSKYV